MPQKTARASGQAPQSTSPGKSTGSASPIGFLTEWNTEITRFYAHRCQQYWTLPLRLQSCRTAGDFKTLQTEFQLELFEDYRGAASKLSKIAGADPGQSDNSLETAYAENLLKAQEDAAEIIEQAKDQAERIVASAHERAAQSADAPKPAQARKRA